MPRSRVSMYECFGLVQGTYLPVALDSHVRFSQDRMIIDHVKRCMIQGHTRRPEIRYRGICAHKLSLDRLVRV